VVDLNWRLECVLAILSADEGIEEEDYHWTESEKLKSDLRLSLLPYFWNLVYRSFPKITPHGALRARMLLNHRARMSNGSGLHARVLIMGASRENGRKNHSLKEERTSTARAPEMSVPPSMSDFIDLFRAKSP